MTTLILRNIPIAPIREVKAPTENDYYGELPDKYDPETWPAYTSLQCYNCTLTSKRIPIFVPTGRSKGTFVRGNGPIYCNVGCLQRSLLDMKLTDSEIQRSLDLTRDLIFMMFGVRVGVITPVSNRLVLKRYAGTKSDADFQEEIIHFCDFIQKCYKNPQDYLEDCK